MTKTPRFPLPPMEALPVDEVPIGPEWQYEPKWDGFRCLVFRHGDKVALQSKAGKPLTRYFPELVQAIQSLKPGRFVLDGEIVIPENNTLSFDALLQRIHPAASRIRKLANDTPATLIVFDLLERDQGSLLDAPLRERRQQLEKFSRAYFGKTKSLRLSPVTQDVSRARKWLKAKNSSLDGIIAKRRDAPYRSGDRTGMQKIKNYRSADCVVGGFRYNEGKPVVGSLLLGLYDDAGRLHHVGFTSNIPAKEKPSLTKKLESIIQPPGFTGRAPGGPSRWSAARSAEWQPLKPKLVVEVAYDHFSGGRFRHGTSLLRWRPDKSARQCLLDQVVQSSVNVRQFFRKIR